MAQVEEALVEILRADATLGSLIGAGGSMRVWQSRLPASADMPAVRYSVVSAPRAARTMDSATNRPIVRQRFQLDAFAADYETSVEVAEAITDALEGFSGIAAGVRITSVFVENETDVFDPDQERERRIVEARVSYADS